ncbi:hypothetical protein SKAU_G00258110 [Synaphobranchus kaupii]|uniref:Uncharacterized protein n=1 Tax=Synaphobranchus kaupii TaxID=118154 RepID=A0A9Q1F4E1_SYNKA|nr:hypothetical protein SKAU_G00258110 [Synaphobranchus kaupii]
MHWGKVEISKENMYTRWSGTTGAQLSCTTERSLGKHSHRTVTYGVQLMNMTVGWCGIIICSILKCLETLDMDTPALTEL